MSSIKQYKDKNSVDKRYINGNISEVVIGDEDGGILTYLEGEKCQSSSIYLKGGIPPSRLTVVESNPETYVKQRKVLDKPEKMGISHKFGDIFKVLKDYKTPHLFLDLMTDFLRIGQIRILRDWFDYNIRWGYEPNLFLTLSCRSKNNGRTYTRARGLERQLSEIDCRIGLKTYYAYKRPKCMTMVFLHFCFHDGDAEFRPQAIIKELTYGWCLVKWWGLGDDYNTEEPPESDAVKLLRALDIKRDIGARILSRCFLKLPTDISEIIETIDIFEDIEWDIENHDSVQQLMEFYRQARFHERNDNRAIFLTGRYLSALFKEVHRKRYCNIIEKAVMEISKEMRIKQEWSREFFTYAIRIKDVYSQFPLLTFTTEDLKSLLRNLNNVEELFNALKNEKVPYFLFPEFWKMRPETYLSWSRNNQESVKAITGDADDIINHLK